MRTAAKILVSVLLVLALGGTLATAEAAGAKRIALKAARLIDGKNDAVIANPVVVIEGNRIVSVTPKGTLPKDAE